MSTSSSILSMLVLTGALAAPLVGQERCEYQRELTGSRAVDAARAIDIRAASGALAVRGRSGAAVIEVRARACASSPELLEELGFATDRSGSTILVETLHPDHDGWRRGEYARVDLEVVVPEDLPVRIEDGSGSIEVYDVADLDVEDGSGSLRVVGVRGDVGVDDGSGEIELTDIRGSVEIHDGSGSIEVADVRGSVEVSDGSGGIRILRVETDVIVHSMGSGGLDVDGVGGDLTVRSAGRGQISYRDVRGQVDVPDRDRRSRRNRRGGN
jgi:hypothetical protein